MKVSSAIMHRSNENYGVASVLTGYIPSVAVTLAHSHQNLNQFKVDA